MLDSQYWQNSNAVLGTAQGRGTTWFVQYQKQHWVLRHYYRGGMIGKINKDKYCFTSLGATRAAREFELLKKLQQLNLPAPNPIAYRVVRKGFVYQADLLSERIVEAEDLVAKLGRTTISEELWRKIGITIKRFHHHGIYHHDLNAHNILIDQQDKVWLIDFDQGEQRKVASSWQQANMSRLLRSFNKEKKRLDKFNWQQSDWLALTQGYDNQ
jgi:3-deoxy-D-manno-octulosonic acid kinase